MIFRENYAKLYPCLGIGYAKKNVIKMEKKVDNDLFLRSIKEAKILNNKKDYNGSKQILVSIFEKKLSNQQTIDACKLLCLIERKIGNYESALKVIKNAVDIARNIIDEVGTDDIDAFASAIETYAICLMNQGIVYEQQEIYANAIPIYRKAKELFRQIYLRNPENPGILINALFTLGMALYNNGDVFAAKETFEEALPLFQENFDGNKELDERYHAIMSILESINENLQ